MKSPVIIVKGRGMTRARSLGAAGRRVKDGDLYLIRRGGYWFRPKAQGYTDDLADAGMFLGKDARGYLSAEGVSLTPLSSMKAILRQTVGEAEARTKRLADMLIA